MNHALARFFYLTILALLLLAAVVGPTVLYSLSPRWSLEPVNVATASNFFFASIGQSPSGRDEVRVDRYDPAAPPKPGNQYRVPEGTTRVDKASTGGNATVTAMIEPNGSQMVTVFMQGNTPWTSLSEYRVTKDGIEPLRHATSNPWLLLLILAALALVFLLRPALKFAFDRWALPPENLESSA